MNINDKVLNTLTFRSDLDNCLIRNISIKTRINVRDQIIGNFIITNLRRTVVMECYGTFFLDIVNEY